ncbi:MAG: hypothetical protein DRH08_07585, partial [Deltaproteobacteria bacterium]
MKSQLHAAGIDIGSTYIKLVLLNDKGDIIQRLYQAHKGKPESTLQQLLNKSGAHLAAHIGITGVLAEGFTDILQSPALDITRCQIKAVSAALPPVSNIMDIGGGSCTLVQLDDRGNFRGYSSNSLCAAGTGAFLDEQAVRLSIDYSDMAAFELIDEPPTVATRCSVFAKSDLIHRQQEGHSKEAMWSGLCRGMTRTLANTLLNGKPLNGATAVIGGVAQNREIIRWLKVAHPDQILVPGNPHLLAALGAARLAAQVDTPICLTTAENPTSKTNITRYPWPLTLEKSTYHSSSATGSLCADTNNNEVRIINWPTEKTLSCYIGIDIGSTSTKLVAINPTGDIIVDIYRKTAGDPIGATQKVFAALQRVIKGRAADLSVLGVGTTGSGRVMVGTVIGADTIINEVSAHVAGATQIDSTVETIFEIGGQDSKYMHVMDGSIQDSNMNYVCAAGTGSFIEEQAGRLGYKVEDVGNAVLGIAPPIATDRCTVFMERDLNTLIQSGASRQDALAAAMVSVIKNYLNKVVGNRYISSKRIFFQGATARNPALVAAIERLLNVEVVVSPHCHVMGAYGVAILARDSMAAAGTTQSMFRGLDLGEQAVTLSSKSCNICQNNCSITIANIAGVSATPSWGYICGRDPDEEHSKADAQTSLL